MGDWPVLVGMWPVLVGRTSCAGGRSACAGERWACDRVVARTSCAGKDCAGGLVLVSSVQHPRQKWKRRKKYDCEREREEEENFQLSSVHLWLKLEFLISLN